MDPTLREAGEGPQVMGAKPGGTHPPPVPVHRNAQGSPLLQLLGMFEILTVEV